MKLRVVCPNCGNELEDEVRTSLSGETFLVCHHSYGSWILGDYRGKQRECGAYIPITLDEELIEKHEDEKYIRIKEELEKG